MSNNNATTKTPTDNAQDTTAKKDPARQPFYFNEDGEFVIETTRGIYIDGQPNTRMTGIFTCNAKTMAQVMAIITGKPVKLLKFTEAEKIFGPPPHWLSSITYNDTYMAIDNSEIGKEIKRLNQKFEEERAKDKRELDKMITEQEQATKELERQIKILSHYNALPWWKRIFKKIKID